MKKSWGFTEKILTGEKKIESRWYMSKSAPWDRIKSGDIVYFKNSGESVTISADVERILQFSDLDPARVKSILYEYGDADGIKREDLGKFFELFKGKKYCILIFLKDPRTVEPFEIDKSGFGSMSAWISVDDIGKIKLRPT